MIRTVTLLSSWIIQVKTNHSFGNFYPFVRVEMLFWPGLFICNLIFSKASYMYMCVLSGATYNETAPFKIHYNCFTNRKGNTRLPSSSTTRWSCVWRDFSRMKRKHSGTPWHSLDTSTWPRVTWSLVTLASVFMSVTRYWTQCSGIVFVLYSPASLSVFKHWKTSFEGNCFFCVGEYAEYGFDQQRLIFYVCRLWDMVFSWRFER